MKDNSFFRTQKDSIPWDVNLFLIQKDGKNIMVKSIFNGEGPDSWLSSSEFNQGEDLNPMIVQRGWSHDHLASYILLHLKNGHPGVECFYWDSVVISCFFLVQLMWIWFFIIWVNFGKFFISKKL